MGGKWDPEKAREYQRRYNRENAERLRQAARDKYWANPEERRASARNYYYDVKRKRRDQVLSELWLAQGGRCYLCEQPFPLADMVLEHDHRCCQSGRFQFCSFCVRGAACARCNKSIGQALDDPDRLELMARNLRAKIAEVTERLAAKPAQASLETDMEG